MLPQTPCPIAEDLERFMVGQVPESEAQVLEQHLAGCAECLSRLEALQPRDELTEALADVFRRGPAPLAEENSRLLAPLFDLGPGAEDRAVETPPALDFTPPPPGGEAPAPDVREAREILGPPQERDEIGRLASYGVLQVLGKGGMGIVFLARQTRPQRLVAVKMILGGRAGREPLTRFRSEAEVVARLQHQNVVQIYEVGEHDGRAYFAMEYVAGGSLADKLATAPLPAQTAARLVQTLAGAMQHAHERGIIHRDLKPPNILLAAGAGSPAEWVPKVTDFGLAKQLEPEVDDGSWAARTASGAILGTPAYMAPEQAVGGKEVGPATDVYALGAILYECLTGRPPFRAATVLQTLEQVRSQEPVPPGRLQPGLPRDLQTICLKCLHKEPARRYASAAELADDLGRFLGREPIRARPVGRAERLWKWARRRPSAAALVVVSGLSALALVLGGLVYNAQLRQAVQKAEDNERKAESNEADANRQHALAVDRYRAASDTLERMVGRLQGKGRTDAATLMELRQKLLEDSLAFYQKSIDQKDDPDPMIRLDAAEAYRKTGAIRLELSQPGPAGECFRQAVALVEGLPAEERERARSQLLLADCHNSLATLEPAEKEQKYQKAAAVYERILRESPDSAEARGGLARIEHNLGMVSWYGKRRAEAEAHYRRAIDLGTALLGDQPGNPAHRSNLANAYASLGALYMTAGPGEKAGPTYEEAVKLLRPLVDRYPEEPEYAMKLASIYNNWSYLLREQGQTAEALRLLGKAIDYAEAVLRVEPRHGLARIQAFNAHGTRALLHEHQGHWADAVKDWDRLLELDQSPERWKRRVLRALDLARVGDHTRAAAEARDLAEDQAVGADGLWSLAIVYARSSKEVRSDSRLAPAQRDARAEDYAGRAVALLRKLKERGQFKEAASALQLRTEPALQPLRGRADFQKLLTEK